MTPLSSIEKNLESANSTFQFTQENTSFSALQSIQELFPSNSLKLSQIQVLKGNSSNDCITFTGNATLLSESILVSVFIFETKSASGIKRNTLFKLEPQNLNLTNFLSSYDVNPALAKKALLGADSILELTLINNQILFSSLDNLEPYSNKLPDFIKNFSIPLKQIQVGLQLEINLEFGKTLLTPLTLLNPNITNLNKNLYAFIKTEFQLALEIGIPLSNISTPKYGDFPVLDMTQFNLQWNLANLSKKPPFLTFLGDMEIGGHEIDFEVCLDISDQQVYLEAKSLPTFNSLAPLIEVNENTLLGLSGNWPTSFSDTFKDLEKFDLKNLFINIDIKSKTWSTCGFTLTTQTPLILLEDVVSITPLLSITVNHAPTTKQKTSLQCLLSGTWELSPSNAPKTILESYLSLPSLDYAVEIPVGHGFNIGALSKAFGEDNISFISLLDKVQLLDFELTGNFKQETLNAEIDIASDWNFKIANIDFKFQNLDMQFDYENKSIQNVFLSGRSQIGPVHINVNGQYDKSTNWVISGGAYVSSGISFTEWFSSLIGSNNSLKNLPANLPDNSENAELLNLYFQYNKHDKSVLINVGLKKSIPIINDFSIDSFYGSLNFSEPDNDLELKANAQIDIADVDILLDVDFIKKPSSTGWFFTGATGSDEIIKIEDLYNFFKNKLGITTAAPSFIDNTTISNLSISLDTVQDQHSFDGTIDILVDGEKVELNLSLILTKEGIQASGTIKIDNSHHFEVDLTKDGNQTAISLACTDTFDIELKDIVTNISKPLGADTPDLSIGVKQPYIIIDKGVGFILSLDLDEDLDLSQLPLAGEELAKDVQIQDLKVVYASKTIQGKNLESINALILSKNLSPIPVENNQLSQGLSLKGGLNVCGKKLSLESPHSASGSQGAAPPSPPVKVGENLGPIHLQSVTPSFKNKKMSLTFNAGITLGGLNMSFQDLKLHGPIDHFSPKLSLKGLGLDYQSPALSIGGAFLHDTGDTYSGMAMLGLKKLELSAFGSYSKVNGDTSLFIYGVLNEPLGGPAFCFVTGLAALFGYNRTIEIPKISEVANYPLVQAAMGQEDSTQLLQEMETDLPEKVGEYIIGLGVKFNSFKVVNSFALLVARLDNNLNFNLIGKSVYIAPDPYDPEPVAQVELDILGSFDPESKNFLAQGQLTSNSWLIDRNCHLQGGFAYAFWTSGEGAGDFVYTFGGYGDHITPPSYYPQNIPALSFSWQYNSDISFKGTGHWALTSSLVAAGVSFNANYNASFFHAWFDLDAYFLITWKPFHYEAGFGVDFGLKVRVDLLFCSVWLGFDISASLNVHGPPFGGTAGLDLSVCTIHINFGDQSGQQLPLLWTDFKNKFLLQKDGKDPLSIIIESGLVETAQENGSEVWIVNPKDLSIATNCIVPSISYQVDHQTNDGTSVTTINTARNSNCPGIAPMDINKGDFTSEHNLIIHGPEKECQLFPLQSKGAVETDNHLIIQNSPKSIWGESMKADTQLGELVEGTMTGLQLKPVKGPTPGFTKEFDRSELAWEWDWKTNSISWCSLISFTGMSEPSFTDQAQLRAATLKSLGFNQEEINELGDPETNFIPSLTIGKFNNV